MGRRDRLGACGSPSSARRAPLPSSWALGWPRLIPGYPWARRNAKRPQSLVRRAELSLARPVLFERGAAALCARWAKGLEETLGSPAHSTLGPKLLGDGGH